MKTGRLSKDTDVRHTIFSAGVIIYVTDHGMQWVSRFYLFLRKFDSEPVSTRNLVVGLCSIFPLSSYLMYSFRYAHNAYNATNLFGKYERSDFSTSEWQSARRSDRSLIRRFSSLDSRLSGELSSSSERFT